jgi:uncharacterized membrane protein YesL
MRDAVSLYGRAVIDLYEEWFSLVLANFACFFCFLPGLAVLYALIWIIFQASETGGLLVGLPPLSVVAVLTGGPALAGIHNLTNPLSHERRIDSADFWEGFKKYYVKSWLILGLWVTVTVTLAVNVWFYRMWWQQGTQIALLPVVLFLWIMVLWLGIGPYLFPLLLEQEDQKVLLTFRNAILLALANPGFTVLVMILSGATLLLSLVFFPLLMLATFSLLALVNNRAIVQLMIRLEEQRERFGLTEEEDGQKGNGEAGD